MPVDPTAPIEISAFASVPDFAKGLVRDLRVRWALEEAGLSYREKLLGAKRPQGYFREQPWGQVPSYRDASIAMFESGAIALHVAEGSSALMPQDPSGRARATAWVLAALNSVEPSLSELGDIDLFHAGEPWTAARRPQVEGEARTRLARLSDWLGDKDHLEGAFTVGDLMMASVLRMLRHTGMLAEFPNLDAYKARCEARPAFDRALAAQLSAFERTERMRSGRAS